jgi:O-methyltransferase
LYSYLEPGYQQKQANNTAATIARSWCGSMINGVLRHAGLELRRLRRGPISVYDGFRDLEPWVAQIIERVQPFTMTSRERISSLCHAVRFVARAKVPGDIVECGVWRGGSMMAAALTLLTESDIRTLRLYDTFEGMPPPSDLDRSVVSGKPAAVLLAQADQSSNLWAQATLDEVKINLETTGYPPERIRYIPGKVEETIPTNAPETIALLRLDTDWYESTKHELENLYPRLAVGGVLIIDDYGCWEGSRRATDEYVAENPSILLQRIDNEGRIAVKIGPVAHGG